jgi:hypothetical protein
VKAIARACWGIFLLRSGPQAFPRSWILLALISIAYLLTDGLLFVAQGVTGAGIVIQTAFDFGLQVLFFAAVLAAKFVLPRLNQTLSAWLGAGVILNLLSLPPAFALLFVTAHWAQDLLLIPVFLSIGWSMAVMTQVLRHALSIGPIFGLVIAAVYTFASIVIFQGLFPT